MSRSGRKLSVLLLLAAAAYLCCTCVFRIGPAEFALVHDRDSGNAWFWAPVSALSGRGLFRGGSKWRGTP